MIDFEFLIETDRSRPGEELEARDRAIHREVILPGAGASGAGERADRAWVLRQWLEARRRAEQGPLPGAVLAGAWRLLARAASVLLLLAGAGAAAQLLRYDGRQPVNVAAYVGCFVVLQVGLVLVALAVFWLRRSSLLAMERSMLAGLLGWIWSALAGRLGRSMLEHATAERRQQLRAFLGTASSRSHDYRRLPFWPVAGLLQWLGVCFNVGVLAATLALVLFSDRAFGWQSAADVSPERVHAALRALALPWSWLLPEGVGVPTLAQVEGSRIILKEGIRRLSTEHLVAWWPFLCLAVGTYGLAPRLMLLGLCRLQQGRALRGLSFQRVDCDRLLERLNAPSITSQGTGLEPPREPVPGAGEGRDPGPDISHGVAPDRGGLLLIDPDVRDQVDASSLRRAVEERFGVRIVEAQAVGLNATELGAALESLRARAGSEGGGTIIVVREAWEPPIAELLEGVRLLRRAWGEEARLILALLGRAEAEGRRAPVRRSDMRVWERETAALGDRRLRVEPLSLDD